MFFYILTGQPPNDTVVYDTVVHSLSRWQCVDKPEDLIDLFAKQHSVYNYVYN